MLIFGRALKELPVFETAFCIFLLVITVFRRELSSNRDYKLRDGTKRAFYWDLISRINNTIIVIVQDWRLRDIIQYYCISSYIIPCMTTSMVVPKVGFPLPANRDSLLIMLEFLNSADWLILSSVSKHTDMVLRNESVWEQLWRQRYSRFWSSTSIIRIRQIRGGSLLWEPPTTTTSSVCHHCPVGGVPSQGWKRFLLAFEECWTDWLLAGCNTESLCLLGLQGGVFDVTPMVHLHPGSPETLLDHAGCDCSVLFEDIGHSSLARTMRDACLLGRPAISGYGNGNGHQGVLTSQYANVLAVTRRRLAERTLSVSVRTGRTACSSSSTSCSDHSGQCKVCFDPVLQRWDVWWTCCGAESTLTPQDVAPDRSGDRTTRGRLFIM
eukprot:gene11503-24044_t